MFFKKSRFAVVSLERSNIFVFSPFLPLPSHSTRRKLLCPVRDGVGKGGGGGPIEFRAPIIPPRFGFTQLPGPPSRGLATTSKRDHTAKRHFLPASFNKHHKAGVSFCFPLLFLFLSGSKARHREREEEESLQNKRRGTACSHGRRVESGQVCWHVSANFVCIMRYVWSFCERFPDRLPATPRLGLCVLFLLLLLLLLLL